jgi:23S rRNA (cytidine1920-2'-O)/16S rRNA (cytidine1409-2'-O)-methyltransferase
VRRRLDAEMVRRGLAGTRTEAADAIRSGKVTVSGRAAAKAGMLVLDAEPIAMAGPARRFASRAGEKLEAALDRFGIDARDRRALDAGASTGGFTDCLLSRGARHVVAVDVGYGQLDWRLREDARVIVMDRTNVRELDPAQLPYAPDLVTADLSFISLRLALPALARCSAPESTFVLLVKPQFEAERGLAPEGVVRDPAVWREVLGSVGKACIDEGLAVRAITASLFLGPAGNAEFFVHAERGAAIQPGPPSGIDDVIASAVAEAEALTSPDHA